SGDDKKDENKLPDNVRMILDKADSFEVYSLDPALQLPPKDKEAPKDKADDKDKDKDKFHGWKVLGKTTVKDKDKKDLLEALQKGIKDNDGVAAAGFIPRHGLRAKYDGKTADPAICLQYLQ